MHLDLATVLVLHVASLFVGSVCFLYVRAQSRETCGLGKLAAAFAILGIGAVLAGAGELHDLPYPVWTLTSFICGPLAYGLCWIGVKEVVLRRYSLRDWWILSLLPAMFVLAIATEFHLSNFWRSTAFLAMMACFALASVWLLMSDPAKEKLPARYALAFSFLAKACTALLALATIAFSQFTVAETAQAFFLLILCHFAIAMFVLIFVRERAERRLQAQAETDILTGVGNRRWLLGRLPALCVPGDAFLIIDIDHFKRVNDQHGHAAGDAALTACAGEMARLIGSRKSFGRMGGEEFGLFVPEALKARPLAIAETLRRAVEALDFVFEGRSIPLTISIGVAIAADRMPVARLLAQADEALYGAKRGGRNRAVLFGEDLPAMEDDGGAIDRRRSALRGQAS